MNQLVSTDDYQPENKFMQSVNSQVNLNSNSKPDFFKCDTVILHATATGNPALRDNKTGTSSFIYELCKEFEKKEPRSIYKDC